MPQQTASAIENNFTAGLKTEFTVLNFPENAATDTDNCLYTLVGDVLRREGIDYELNYSNAVVDRTNKAITTHRWLNAGGDGSTQILVVQLGDILYFYLTSAATQTSPISAHRLASTVVLTSSTVECQYAEGNGYLVVYKADQDPFYCTYASGAVTATTINVQIRDFTGIPEPGVADDFRPLNITSEHLYNLQNQGWTQGSPWTATSSTSVQAGLGTKNFTIQTGLTITGGTSVNVVAVGTGVDSTMTGTVNSYNSGSGALSLNITSVFPASNGITFSNWTINAVNVGLINTWVGSKANYPSNSDVWWLYKNASGVFDPTVQVTFDLGPAPKGHYVLNAFEQQRSVASSIPGLTITNTSVRPKTGTWFQGRVWYAGTDASFPAQGDAPASSWSEVIYFSQVIVNTSQFGKCYQTNDPTSESTFDLLPTDGGTIVIQGSGSVYQLFPIQNGLLVFAANGIWFITGSQGIGFAANDYTITKISGVQSMSCTSYVNVQGYPTFWNEEGIYSVSPSAQGGGLTVSNLALGTILSFYNAIPLSSKKYVRGAFNPIDYVIQWVYRNEEETNTTSRYSFDRILNYNISNKSFYPYSISGTPSINGINYVAGPGGSNTPESTFKYLCSTPSSGTYNFTFADERDTRYLDWFSFDNIGTDYESFFITGFKAHGNAQRRFQPGYIYVFSKSVVPTFYKIQGIWNFAANVNSGKWSTEQYVSNGQTNFGTLFRRHRIRGHGIALQFRVSSVSGQPFDIAGWSTWITMNVSI